MRGLDRLTQICHSFEKPRAAVVLVAGLTAVLLGTACNGDSPTSPTTATTTTTIPPTTTETFEGTVTAGGSTFYSFSIEQSGTVNITLLSVSGTYVPSTVWLGLGIGQPDGTDCITTSTVNTAAGASAQLTGTYGPGVFCAKVSDIGNLFGTAAFSASIEHP